MQETPADPNQLMHPSLRHAGLRSFAELSPHDVAALLAYARMLLQAAQQGTVQPLLRAKNLGLLCEADDTGHDDAALFRRAAVELGAHVAHIRPSLSEHSSVQELQYTARMLGRLYDAVECQRIPADLVQRLREHVDVPVYDGLASPDNPTAKVADLLDAATPPADRRRIVVQAVLLSTVA